MGMTGGSVRTILTATAKAVYPPQGIPSEGAPLKDIALTQFANDQPTTLQHGLGAGTFDHYTLSDRAVLPNSSVTYDLFTGTDLRGPVGETCPFRIVRQVKIAILSGGASGVRVGGASSNEWLGWFAAAGDQRDIYAGGPPFWDGDPEDGKPVTSSAKNLKIENLSTTTEAVIRVFVSGSVHAPGTPIGWLWAWTYS